MKPEMEMKPEMGKKYADTITGTTGVVTATAEYLNQPPQSLLEYTDSTGRHAQSWFENSRLQEKE